MKLMTMIKPIGWVLFSAMDIFTKAESLLAIKLGGIDESHLYKFKECIQAENPVKIEYHNITGNKLVKIELSGKQIVSDLQKLGVFKKENRKQVPNIDKNIYLDRKYKRARIESLHLLNKKNKPSILKP